MTTPEFLPKVRPPRPGPPRAARRRRRGRPGATPGRALRDLAELEPHAAGRPRRADDLAALLYTGGTTGRSKGVMLTHARLYVGGRRAHERGVRHRRHSRSLLPLPLSHAYGLIVTIVGLHAPSPARAC